MWRCTFVHASGCGGWWSWGVFGSKALCARHTQHTEQRFQPGVREPMKVMLLFESLRWPHRSQRDLTIHRAPPDLFIPLPRWLRFYPAMVLPFLTDLRLMLAKQKCSEEIKILTQTTVTKTFKTNSIVLKRIARYKQITKTKITIKKQRTLF